MARIIIIIGIVLILTGLLWSIIPSLGLGKLPGDLYWKKNNLSFYIPITTSLIVSGIMGIILWLIRKL
ncbi:MAG: DUF2905 domain-containing protein [Bacteroidetes bacterium]|nr:DUF2905 domain-containing protein [Bacteroidota bacterium]